jgi:AcrR family transcriptional regulator
MVTRNEQKEKRRKQILSAGLDLFIQKGLVATKVSDIADAVGMSVGLLFHYFESKEQLYEELIKIGLTKSQTTLSADSDEPLQFFTEIAGNIFNKNNTFTVKMFVLMNQAANCELLIEDVRRQLRQDNLIESANIIRTGQENGTIRDGDPLALSVAFWGAVQGVCQIIVQNPDFPFPSAEWLVNIIKREDTEK